MFSKRWTKSLIKLQLKRLSMSNCKISSWKNVLLFETASCYISFSFFISSLFSCNSTSSENESSYVTSWSSQLVWRFRDRRWSNIVIDDFDICACRSRLNMTKNCVSWANDCVSWRCETAIDVIKWDDDNVFFENALKRLHLCKTCHIL